MDAGFGVGRTASGASRASPDLECALGDAETIAALAEECDPLARVTARIVELGGKPIPPRPR
jgi:hypothetical protein